MKKNLTSCNLYFMLFYSENLKGGEYGIFKRDKGKEKKWENL